MKTRFFFIIFAFVSIFAAGGPAVAEAQNSVSFEFFYDSLDPYGEWVEVPEYGYCWHPQNVDEDWAPYTDGYWAYTDAGWTWVSYEDWGAITYHYGRWVRIAGYGWSWVPDYEWGPAWVSWRKGNDYVGWAPLPPEARFVRRTGFSVWVDLTYGIGPANYNFCSYSDFGAPLLRPFIIDRRRNVSIINNTANITNITINQAHNVIFNGGLDPRLIERRSSRPIPTLNLVRQTDLGSARAASGGLYSRQQGNQLFVVAPQIERSERKIKPANVAQNLAAGSVDKGWNAVPQSQVTEIQTRMRREIKDGTPQNAPAKPVTRDQLKIVQERIKAVPVKTPVTTLLQSPGAPAVTQEVVPTTIPLDDKTRGRENVTAKTSAQPTAPVKKETITAAPTPPAIDEITTHGRGSHLQKIPQQSPTSTQPVQIPQQVVQPTPNPELEQRKRQQEASQQQKKLEAEQQRQMETGQARQRAQQQQRQVEAEQAKERSLQQEQQQADRQRQQEVQQQRQQEQVARQRQQEVLQQQRQAEAEQVKQRAQQQQIDRQRQAEALREQQKQQIEQSRHRVEQPPQPPPQQVQPKQPPQVAPARKLTKEEEEQLRKQQQQQ